VEENVFASNILVLKNIIFGSLVEFPAERKATSRKRALKKREKEI
jgi:hypothetical protein